MMDWFITLIKLCLFVVGCVATVTLTLVFVYLTIIIGEKIISFLSKFDKDKRRGL